MSKVQILATVLLVVGAYSYMQGRSKFDTTSILSTWLPVGAAAYAFFA